MGLSRATPFLRAGMKMRFLSEYFTDHKIEPPCLMLVHLCSSECYRYSVMHVWQSQVESGLIRLVIIISRMLFEITPDFLCPFMND